MRAVLIETSLAFSSEVRLLATCRNPAYNANFTRAVRGTRNPSRGTTLVRRPLTQRQIVSIRDMTSMPVGQRRQR